MYPEIFSVQVDQRAGCKIGLRLSRKPSPWCTTIYSSIEYWFAPSRVQNCRK
jgi:hypothetical protein